MTAFSAAASAQEFRRHDDARIGAGLQWNFGSTKPELVLSARWTRAHTNEMVLGGKVDIAFPLLGDLRPTIRLLGLAGNCDVQGEAGIGYSFANARPLLGLGLQAPYVNVGVNYHFQLNTFAPYAGFNTFGCASGPRQIPALSPPPSPPPPPPPPPPP